MEEDYLYFVSKTPGVRELLMVVMRGSSSCEPCVQEDGSRYGVKCACR